MATPMTATQVVAQLKKWGLKYVEIPGWATHNRAGHGAWGPVNGFIWHHTGADVSNGKSYAAGTLYNGLASLPGPLCHFSIGTDGTVYLVGWGRANHAGGGDPAVLQHVIDEDYSGQLHPTKGNSNGVDGNARFYGVEIQYSGSHKMTDAQYAAARRLSAAILDFHGWSEKSVIAHGEWSSDKWDPGYAPNRIMAMPGVRADVKATLAAGPGGTPSVPQEDDMDPIDVWAYKGKKNPAGTGAETHDAYWYLRESKVRLDSLTTQVAALSATVKTLAGQVGKDVDTDTVVAAVQKAIADAVVKVDVDVTGAQTQEA
ncbi:peptidoglycan recognition protein family protein [Streptomyces mexicanus]|uniref:peptidoglycan recognition protein family protein n=1 Tax=Streptomyces mexicanus TaxID=178566 RepID=UPI003664ED7F